MNCQVTKITSVKVIHALPDAQYHTNSIRPMYFVKKDGVLEFRLKGDDEVVLKTIEEFATYWNNKSIVGPLIEFEFDEEVAKDIEEFSKAWKENAGSGWRGW